jgi:ELMO domain-containing protein
LLKNPDPPQEKLPEEPEKQPVVEQEKPRGV